MLEASFIAILVAVFILAWHYFWVLRPLRKIKDQLVRIRRGDFSGRVSTGPRDLGHVSDLATLINDLSGDMDETWKALRHNYEQLTEVFSSMPQGVIAVDADEKIMMINDSAASLFGISEVESVGKSIQETLRMPEIQDFIQISLRSDEPFERDVELRMSGEPVIIHLRGSPLKNAKGQRIGTVLGYNDISQLRRLESHRRDFVANVSHELRTPLTSIQGFAETVMKPEVKDPEQIKKFVEIIYRHSNRLSGIIEDLLALSRVEKDVEENSIELRTEPLRPVVASAVEMNQFKAKTRQIEIGFDCSPDIKAKINSTLLEQAVSNLIGNAIQYSEEGKKILVEVRREEKEVSLVVIDQGHGIPKEHLPRLFERFYRVDKGRSRNSGGTGLGLSIVKHVTIAHRGRLDVQSELGKGSRFTIHLPV